MDRELLDHIAAMMQENNKALVEFIQQENEKTRSDLIAYVGEVVSASRNEIMAYIENTTNKRIDTLFDGYAGTQERITILQKQVDSLETRMRQLEDIVKSYAS